MENLTMKELSKIALNLEITLSYKDENGKRQRLNKSELINAIKEKQKPVKIKNATMYGSNGKTENESIKFNLKTVVVDSKELLSSGKIEQVKLFISKLINDINSERKNKLLVKHMSMKLEILKSLVKSYNIKKEAL